MLNELVINKFKCFDHVEVKLNKLNVFAGTNSSGKSSAIQAFLLLCNNANKNASPLNGMWLRLGAFDECRNHKLNARSFDVGVCKGNELFKAEFRSLDDEGNDVEVFLIKESNVLQELINLEKGHVYYLPANRIGPEDIYQKNFDRINHLGNKSEYIVDFLFKNRKKEVTPVLVIDNASFTLEHQVNYWLGKLFGIKNVIQDLGLSNTLSLEYSFHNGRPVRPYHMGSGVSFAIGVIVTCLFAEPGDIIVIENPEIHLHPRAQSELTEFLCCVANAGIQIILETHSDHVFNGIRKAIVKKEIKNTDTVIHFFQLNDRELSNNTLVELNEQGRVLTHPKGLFDQFDDDLDKILGI
jgi:predicted ATPase